MRAQRKTRDQARRAILLMLRSHAGTRFKASHLAAQLCLGRERTAALLAGLLDRREVQNDGKAWFVGPVPGDVVSANGSVDPPPGPRPPSVVQTWIELGREIFGDSVKIRIEL